MLVLIYEYFLRIIIHQLTRSNGIDINLNTIIKIIYFDPYYSDFISFARKVSYAKGNSANIKRGRLHFKPKIL